MDKLKMETSDMAAENIEKIGALFPSAVTEMRGEDGSIKKGVNFEMLKQLLSPDVVEEGDERYEFTWVGKKQAIAEAARPTTCLLYTSAAGYPPGQRSDGHLSQRHRVAGTFLCGGK